MSFAFETNKLIPVTGIDVFVLLIISAEPIVVILASSLLVFTSGALHYTVLYLKISGAVSWLYFENKVSFASVTHPCFNTHKRCSQN
jgi:hypothetical protein